MPTLTERIGDLAVAIRGRLNAMTPRLVPPGGAAGQVLAKSAAGDYALAWSSLIKGDKGDSLSIAVVTAATLPPEGARDPNTLYVVKD